VVVEIRRQFDRDPVLPFFPYCANVKRRMAPAVEHPPPRHANGCEAIHHWRE
jgi:hypothetical protein